KRLGYIVVIIALCAAIVVPLMMNARAVTGKLDISKKTVSARILIESILFDKTVNLGGGEKGAFRLLRRIIKVYHPFVFFFLLALSGERRSPGISPRRYSYFPLS
ncbi:MAG: hypothetical protein JRJ26_11685, partial [Deltaproteobacteria bacterium]|nr:hypothetical protein [Deltaproteobacteria bacterium]